MNLGQIRTASRYKLNESGAAFWSDAELNEYINQEYAKIWQLLINYGYRSTLTTDDLSITANTRTVALPTDFLKARLLEHKVGNVYYPCKYYQRFDTSVGDSTVGGSAFGDYYSFAYSFLGDDIVLEPTPITSETDSLRLTYFKSFTELSSDSDTPSFPSIYHKLLVLGCVISAKAKEEMVGGGGVDSVPFIKEYNDLFEAFKNNVSNQTSQRIFVEPFGIL